MTVKQSAADVYAGYSNPLGYIVSTGIEVIRKDRPKRPTPAQRSRLIEAGYTPAIGKGRAIAARPWFDPSGRAIGNEAARQIARQLPQPAPAPAPQLPTGGDILDDLLRRPSGRIGTGPLPRTEQIGRDLLGDLLKRPRSVPPTPDSPPRAPARAARTTRAGRLLRVLGRAGGVLGGILYPSETSPDDVLYPPGTAIPVPQPDRPSGPPRRPVLARDPRDLPKLPEPWPGSIPDRTGPPREPLLGSPAPWPIVLLPAPDARQLPKRPRLPSVLPTKAGLVDPVTTTLPNPLAPPASVRVPSFRPPKFDVSNPLITGETNTAEPAPRARVPLTMAQAIPLGSTYREPPSDRCSCPPKRKRKPSEGRKVCYVGTYREKSRGLTKSPKRKVQCL